MKELTVNGYSNPVLCVRKAIEALYPEAVFDEQNVQAVANAIGDRPDIPGRCVVTVLDAVNLAKEAGFTVWIQPKYNNRIRFEVGTL